MHSLEYCYCLITIIVIIIIRVIIIIIIIIISIIIMIIIIIIIIIIMVIIITIIVIINFIINSGNKLTNLTSLPICPIYFNFKICYRCLPPVTKKVIKNIFCSYSIHATEKYLNDLQK